MINVISNYPEGIDKESVLTPEWVQIADLYENINDDFLLPSEIIPLINELVQGKLSPEELESLKKMFTEVSEDTQEYLNELMELVSSMIKNKREQELQEIYKTITSDIEEAGNESFKHIDDSTSSDLTDTLAA